MPFCHQSLIFRKNNFMRFEEYYNISSDYLFVLEWINKNVSFPSCMVDRITPRSPDELKEEIFTKFKIREHCSVMAEPFIQWVIEDNFIGNRPKLEDVGVQFVNNVFPFDLDKKSSSAFSIKAYTARPTNFGLSPSGNAVISV